MESFKNVKSWLDQTMNMKEFWESLQNEKPTGVMIFATTIEKGIETNKRVQMFFENIKIQIYAFEKASEQSMLFDYCQLDKEFNESSQLLLKKNMKKLEGSR